MTLTCFFNSLQINNKVFNLMENYVNELVALVKAEGLESDKVKAYVDALPDEVRNDVLAQAAAKNMAEEVVEASVEDTEATIEEAPQQA